MGVSFCVLSSLPSATTAGCLNRRRCVYWSRSRTQAARVARNPRGGSEARHFLRRDRLQAAEAALAAMERAEGFRKIVRLEFRPHPFGEVQLGIGAFPEHEIRQPLFAAGADDEVD